MERGVCCFLIIIKVDLAVQEVMVLAGPLARWLQMRQRQKVIFYPFEDSSAALWHR